MAELVVPPLGESITEAVVAKWLKQVGEPVAAGEPVADLETDKITVQLPSPIAGLLASQGAVEGSTVKPGDVIGKVEAGQAAAASPAAAPPAAASAAAAPPAAAPPAAAPPAARQAGTQAPTMPLPTQVAPLGVAGAPPPASADSVAKSLAALARPDGNGESFDKAALLKLTPSQRVQAREVGAIPQKSAVQAHAQAQGQAPAAAASPAAAPAGPSVDDRLAHVDPRDEVIAMSPLRKRVAERLVQAQHEAAALTTFNEADMTEIMSLRARYKDSFEKAHGVKLGFMSFFVKACVAACKAFPGVNAEVIGGSIVYKKHYDFGIAVSTPKGLVVPVLRDCDSLSFAGVEKGILALADKARSGKLALADLTGGTFSITNGGIYGSMMSTPLLNYPQTGILGMHNIVKRAVVIDDAVQVRPMMYIALSYDHRVVDGREAVSFLVAVKERLEAPDRLMFEV
jgi:2-oxoglutarate dehydrogenase E2 component (dihydrolipoamide succinyltransferase)